MNDTAAAAQRWGVEPGYHDVFGTWRAAPAATVQKVIAALSATRVAPTEWPRSREHAPLQMFQGDGTKTWGIAIQLYSVRSARNWGIGDFMDLQDIVKIAAASGAAAIGVNPLHALFIDHPEMASPYAPSSRLFLNPLYIAVEALDEFNGLDIGSLKVDINAARTSALVDYSRVAKLKLAILRIIYNRFLQFASPVRRADFEDFQAKQGDTLKRLGCYEMLRRRYAPEPWWRWPEPWKNPDAKTINIMHSDERDCGFYEFLQWVAERQLAECQRLSKQNGMTLGLYLDLAVGVDPCGFDAWVSQNLVLAGFCIGAPPDAFNLQGQNWGLAPFNPHALPADNFSAFRRLLSAVMRNAGVIRLDHVLGLLRLFLIPKGEGASQGVYVRFPFAQLLDVIAEESMRHRCVVIGEDLGTIPEGFRDAIMRQGVWTCRVMQFERHDNGSFKLPSEYPAGAVATFNTHDLPTFRGWLSGRDIAVRRAIGFDSGEDENARAHVRQAFHDVLARFGGGFDPDQFAVVAAFLAATPCRLVTAAIEDMLDVAEQVNLPGTTGQYPNWRRKVPVPLESWTSQPTFRSVTAAFDSAGRGRSNL